MKKVLAYGYIIGLYTVLIGLPWFFCESNFSIAVDVVFTFLYLLLLSFVILELVGDAYAAVPEFIYNCAQIYVVLSISLFVLLMLGTFISNNFCECLGVFVAIFAFALVIFGLAVSIEYIFNKRHSDYPPCTAEWLVSPAQPLAGKMHD